VLGVDISLNGVNLLLGDCMDRLKEIPDESIDLILADPPFGTMTSLTKRDMSWDVKLETREMFKQCFRVLKNKSTMILFSQGPYTNELITNAHGNMPFSYRMIWVKDHFGNPLIAKVAPVNMFEDICVFYKRAEDMRGHPLQQWFNDELKSSGFTVDQIIKLGGSGGFRHHFTNGKVFRVPNEDKYAILGYLTGMFNRDHSELVEIDKKFKRGGATRTFNLPDGDKTKSNIFTYSKDYNSVHETQKPIALLENLIATFSNHGDHVLDFTMGSGSTGVACVNTGRQFTGIELANRHYANACDRVLTALS
jgi:site-specific DNA-methyltransferase (adenine-specific)